MIKWTHPYQTALIHLIIVKDFSHRNVMLPARERFNNDVFLVCKLIGWPFIQYAPFNDLPLSGLQRIDLKII